MNCATVLFPHPAGPVTSHMWWCSVEDCFEGDAGLDMLDLVADGEIGRWSEVAGAEFPMAGRFS